MSPTKKQTVTGLNIQYPISQLIISGEKTVETRTYPLPERLVGKTVALIETPGKKGQFKARIIATVRFGPSFPYRSRAQFYSDKARHLVEPSSDWAWTDKKPKWGWPVEQLKIIAPPIEFKGRRGIIYTNNISL